MDKISLYSWQKAAGLFGLAFIVRLFFALQLSFPPLDDPAYYIQAARSLQRATPFEISIIWNFNPRFDSVTHIGMEFWQPLTSFAIALSLLLFGDTYFAAQLPSLISGATLPVFAYYFARRILSPHRSVGGNYTPDTTLPITIGEDYTPDTPAKRHSERSEESKTLHPVQADALPVEGLALTAAFFVLLNPLMIYQSGLPTSSMLYAALVCAALMLLGEPYSWKNSFGFGLLAGLAYLTRTPALFLILTWLIIMLVRWVQKKRSGWLPAFGAGIIGIILPVGAWSIRNLLTFGFISSPAAFQSLFLLDYESLFNYNRQVSLQTWLQGGIGQIIAVRLEALGATITTLNAMLPPNLLPAAISLGVMTWRVTAARPAALYCGVLFLGLPLIFGVVSTNGTYYQSVGSCAPFLTVGLIYGLWVFGAWATKQLNRPQLRLAVLLPVLFFAINVFWMWQTAQAVLANDRGLADQYMRVKAWLQDNPAPVVIASQPSSVNYVARIPAVRLPAQEDLQTLREVAKRYHARYIIVTENAGLYPDLLTAPTNNLFPKVYSDPKGDIIIFSVPE